MKTRAPLVALAIWALLTLTGCSSPAASNASTAVSTISSLYVIDSGADTISALGIEAGGGIVSLGTPAYATGKTPTDIAISPKGSYLYVSNAEDDSLSAFSIASSGALAALSTPDYATASTPYAIAVLP